jgi:hypothetical protein
MSGALLVGALAAGCTFGISPVATPFTEPTDPAFDVIGDIVSACRDRLTVTTTEDRDDGGCSTADCSLLEAVDLANRCPGTQTVQLPSGSMASAVEITDDVVFVGQGDVLTELVGHARIDAAAHALISDLTFRSGGLFVGADASLDLLDARIEGVANTFYDSPNSPFQGGAGLINQGTAVLDAVVIQGNHGWEQGGGVLSEGHLVLRNAVLEANEPAGIHVLAGTALVETSVLRGNTSGALVFWEFGPVTLEIIESTVTANTGNGVGGGVLRLERSAITDNGGSGVSGICLNLTNSTISGNAIGVETPTRGICAEGPNAVLQSMTIAENDGAGVLSGNGEVRIQGSILSANAGGDCVTAGGTIVSDDHNLDGDSSCPLSAAGDLPSTDPRLEPLSLNGGTTLNHALGSGSPAIDAGGTVCPTVDQRGAPRPVGSTCDIGAFEAGGLVPLSGSAPTATPAGSPEPHPIARVTTDAFCRTGPGTVYSAMRFLAAGTVIELTAQNDFLPQWWRAVLPDGGGCWVSDVVLEVEGPAADLPRVEAPPTPTPTLRPAPAQGCLIYDDSTPNNPTDTVCVPRACTPNDQPGGSCTP